MSVRVCVYAAVLVQYSEMQQSSAALRALHKLWYEPRMYLWVDTNLYFRICTILRPLESCLGIVRYASLTYNSECSGVDLQFSLVSTSLLLLQLRFRYQCLEWSLQSGVIVIGMIRLLTAALGALGCQAPSCVICMAYAEETSGGLSFVVILPSISYLVPLGACFGQWKHFQYFVLNTLSKASV